jgi:hypothetical protein
MATEEAGFREEVWATSAMVGIAGVICGTILASKHFALRAETERLARTDYSSKPHVDADAYDVVGSRG